MKTLLGAQPAPRHVSPAAEREIRARFPIRLPAAQGG